MNDLGRVPGIDTLRGLSIVLVVWHHLGLRVPLPEAWPQPLREALTLMGFESVFVFFAISGFLITSHSLARWGAPGTIDARAFYRRRAWRILPLLAVLVAVLAVLHLAHANHYVIDRADQSLPAALGAAAVFCVNMYESVTGYLPASWDVLWSLSVEELFYLAFPLVCLTLGCTRALVPALVLLAVSMPWTRAAMRGHGLWYEKADLPGLSAIACGVLAALAVRQWPRVPRALSAGLIAAGSLLMALVFLDEGVVWHVLHNGTLLLLATSAAAMCAAFAWAANEGGTGAPSTPSMSLPMRLLAPLRACGRLSYEIYLTHMFVVWGVVDAFAAAAKPEAAVPLVYAITLALAWAAGALVERGVSAPVDRWRRAGAAGPHAAPARRPADPAR
jgi:peptidoglycan/LPS O-acetylase OafA/YrhL